MYNFGGLYLLLVQFTKVMLIATCGFTLHINDLIQK